MDQARRLTAAKQALMDYFESLEPDRREQALAFQRELEAESGGTPDGMLQAILVRLQFNNQRLINAANQAVSHLASVIATDTIHRAMQGKS